MTQVILIVIGLVIVILLLLRRTREPIFGICAVAVGIDTKKKERKDKILKLFEEAQNKSLPPSEYSLLQRENKSLPPDSTNWRSGVLPLKRGELSNSDIREALKIPERSVVRYLDELEREGKVAQVGSTGRSVIYRLK